MSQLITMLAILASAVSITIIDRVFDTCADSIKNNINQHIKNDMFGFILCSIILIMLAAFIIFTMFSIVRIIQ